MKIIALLLASLASVSALHAQAVAYEQDFNNYDAGLPAEELKEFYVWSEFPHPLNPTTTSINGNMALALNSSMAYKEKAGSSVLNVHAYQAVTGSVSFYANVALERPWVAASGATGIALYIDQDYNGLIRWDASLTSDAVGAITVRVDETILKTGERKTLVEKSLPKLKADAPIPFGLRLSRETGLLEVLVARAPVLNVTLSKHDFATLPTMMHPGIFAFNGQAARFDDLKMIIDESTEPAKAATP